MDGLTELEKQLLEALKRSEKEQSERNEQLSKQVDILQSRYDEAVSSFQILAQRYDDLNRSISRLLSS